MKLLRNNRVAIFADTHIKVDFNLPKHQKGDNNMSLTAFNMSTLRTPASAAAAPTDSLFVDGEVDMEIIPLYDDKKYINFDDLEKKQSWWRKFIYFFNAYHLFKDSKAFMEENDKRIQRREIEKEEREIEEERIEASKASATEFFSDIKASLSKTELHDYKTRIAQFLKEMDKAKKLGQTAMWEQMNASVEIMKYDALLQAKAIKHISEADMVKLANNAKRGLCIDYIENFSRIIPDEVLDAKLKADELCIFDNYVVVHFDPEDTGSQKTEKEKLKEEKKDPILFGIIAGSTNLYFVADWIDEYCDLTLEKAIELINKQED